MSAHRILGLEQVPRVWLDLAKVGSTVREHALRVSKQFGYDPSVSRYPLLRPAEEEKLSS